MVRYIMLLHITDRGMANIKDSPARSEAFTAAAAKAGAKIEFIYWTLGPYDVAVGLTAPDEATAVAVALDLNRLGNVRTTMLRAFDRAEFAGIIGRLT